ncbi:MAG: hypothetical protein ABSC62_05480 [Terracidiphilus sp.]|jgi:hypothetical protein
MIQAEFVLTLVLIFSIVLAVYRISRQLEAVHDAIQAVLEKVDDLVVQTCQVDSKADDFLKKSDDDFDGDSML